MTATDNTVLMSEPHATASPVRDSGEDLPGTRPGSRQRSALGNEGTARKSGASPGLGLKA
jgi:hypothetical protein